MTDFDSVEYSLIITIKGRGEEKIKNFIWFCIFVVLYFVFTNAFAMLEDNEVSSIFLNLKE